MTSFIDAVNGLEYNNTQPVSFKLMEDLAEIIHDDIPRVERSEEDATIITPDDLIPFIP